MCVSPSVGFLEYTVYITKNVHTSNVHELCSY